MFKFFIKFILIYFVFLIDVNAESVKKIIILGNDRISKDTIILFSEIALDENLNNDDLNNIVKKLYNTSFFKDVSVSLINTNLKITVVENPIIQNLKIDGVRSKELKKLIIQKISLKNSSSFNEFSVKKDLRVIENILQSLGYYFSKTEISISDNDNKTVDLTYLIDLGEKSYISEILFLGDKKFKSGNLQNVIASEVNRFWKIISKKKFLNKERIELDKRLLINFYKNKGFYNVKIESNTVNYSTKNDFQLVFNIDSGERFYFNNFIINLPESYDQKYFAKIQKRLNKSKGEFYSYKVLENILSEIEKIAFNENYEFVDATIDETIFQKNKINTVINLSESSKLYVKKINITGNSITIEDVLRNELIVDEGDPLNNILLKKSINNIRSLNIFKKVNTSIEDTANNSEKIINIDVIEKATGEISAGAGAGTSGVSTMFGVNENNFLGKGIRLNSNLSIGSEQVKGLFSVVNPNYKNTDKDLIFSIESSTLDRLKDYGYKSSRYGFSLGTRFEHLDDFFITPKISSFNENLETSSTASNALKKQKGNYFDTKFSYLIDLDKRNETFQTTGGYRSRFNQTIPVISESLTLINGYELNTYHEYLFDNVAKTTFYVSTANSIGDKDVKVSDRQYIPSSKLRGFEPGKVGPIDNGDFIGGNYLTAFNLSSDLNILESFETTSFNIFLDIANVWGVDYSSDIDESNKIRSAVGISLDLFTPVGPLNFSLAQPIMKKNTDKTETFRFNLGTTF
mgnify:FL=1